MLKSLLVILGVGLLLFGISTGLSFLEEITQQESSTPSRSTTPATPTPRRTVEYIPRLELEDTIPWQFEPRPLGQTYPASPPPTPTPLPRVLSLNDLSDRSLSFREFTDQYQRFWDHRLEDLQELSRDRPTDRDAWNVHQNYFQRLKRNTDQAFEYSEERDLLRMRRMEGDDLQKRLTPPGNSGGASNELQDQLNQDLAALQEYDLLLIRLEQMSGEATTFLQNTLSESDWSKETKRLILLQRTQDWWGVLTQ